MSEPAYSGAVLEHFVRPRNAGMLPASPDVITGAAGDEAREARFALSARITDGRIGEMRFRSYGCPHCIAAGSWLSERLIGAEFGDLLAWGWREAADALEIPAEKRGRLLILEDAVRALAENWRERAYHHEPVV